MKLPDRNLDILRAIAVLCVVGSHVAVATGHPADSLGRVGVLLFFVHTSLVLMGSIERTNNDPHWVRDFYVRRAFRIYPLAIAVILGVVLLRMPFPTPLLHGAVVPFEAPSVATVIANVGLFQNVAGAPPLLNVLWTLPLELQMYVLLPACFLIARRSVRLVTAAWIFGVIVAALWGAYMNDIPGLWRLTTIGFVPCFLAGVLCYAILVQHNGSVARQLDGRWWLLLVLVHVVGYIALSTAVGQATWPQWVVCLSLGVVIPQVANLGASLLTRVAAIVAKYSYGIYLLHVPSLWIAVTLFRGRPDAVVWIAAASLTAGLSWLAFHTIEEPGIALGKRAVRPYPARLTLPVSG